MSTDVHAALPRSIDRQARQGPDRWSVLFWGAVVLLISAAVVRPFLPPRAMTDTLEDSP